MKSPGDYIRDALASKNWGQDDLARVLGRPPSRVNEMIQGKAPISLEMAVALSAALGDSPADWMQRDADFRLSNTSTEADDVRKKAALYDLAPVRDMEKRGWIRKTATAAELENELKSFFGVTELTPAPSIAATARRTGGSEEAQELTPAQRAWCFRARALASE